MLDQGWICLVDLLIIMIWLTLIHRNLMKIYCFLVLPFLFSEVKKALLQMSLNKSAMASNLDHKLFKIIASSTVKLVTDLCHLSFFIAKHCSVTVNRDIFWRGGLKANALRSSAVKYLGAGSGFYFTRRVLHYRNKTSKQSVSPLFVRT